MRIVETFDETPAFEVLGPRPPGAPVVFNSPHSGACYPRQFLRAIRLDRQTIRRSEDTYVDELFAGVVTFGAPLMRAHFPRVFIDVNREAYELDPAMFDGELPGYANSASARVAGGLGTIARVVADSQEIYRTRLGVADAMARIEAYYKPYHATLESLLETTLGTHGCVLLVDCHSMPSSARGIDGPFKPDIILGDRYGTSCLPGIADSAARILAALGYRVGRNRPYAGGYITERYGRPAHGMHALQIELSRALYMDEATNARHPGFERLHRDLTTFARALIEDARVKMGGDGGTAIAAD
jgi:N-formylglutamate amidohydrolase